MSGPVRDIVYIFQGLPPHGRVEIVTALMQHMTGTEARLIQALSEELLVPQTHAVRQAEVLANNPAWITGLLQDPGVINAAHILLEHIPLIKRDNIMASDAATRVLIQVPWHCTERDSRRFCPFCHATIRAALAHPAFTEPQRFALAAQHAELTAHDPPLEDEFTGSISDLSERSRGSLRGSSRHDGESSSSATANSSSPGNNSATGNNSSASGSNSSGSNNVPSGPPPIASVSIIGINKYSSAKDYAFQMEVVWKSGEVTYTARTHDEFYELHCKVRSVYR